MKKLFWIALPLCLASVGTAAFLRSPAVEAAADTGPVSGSLSGKNITLRDNTSDEIRKYYASLEGLSSSELQGTNLLKNLRPILQNFTYYSYDNVWKIYEITDREWSLSPPTNDTYDGTVYNASTKTYTKYSYGSNSDPGNDPYVHTLYRNRDENGVTVEAARIKEWGEHNHGAGNDNNATNREHVWCQSRGFKADSGAEGPAGTDVHHLISGDSYVNQTPHNNTPYGFVNPAAITTDSASIHDWLSGNIKGTPTVKHNGDEAKYVFEPQDSDKGDIARAVFYMAACYNNLSGNETITQFNPNLTIANYATDDGKSEISSAEKAVAMGTLSDLLSWHKMDPVDEYEIHRNNLIYNNYQHNRNPFIDFPEWVDYIWGTTTYDLDARKTLTYNTTPTGYVDLEQDRVNGYRSDTPEPAYDPKAEPEGGAWIKAADVRVGDELTLVAENAGTGKDETYAFTGISDTDTKYGLGSVMTVEDSAFPYASATSLTLCEGSEDDTFALQITGSNPAAYLACATDSKNTLSSSNQINANSSWTIEVDNLGVATITNAGYTGRRLQWLNTSGQYRFACYTSNQASVCFYQTVKTSATKWSSDFLNSWTAGCDPQGLASSLSWAGAKTAYKKLHEYVWHKLKTYLHDSTTIGLAVERYDYIVGKYDNLEDFLNRTQSNFVLSSVSVIQNDVSFAWIIVVLLTSAAIATPLIFIALRGRKTKND